MKVTVLSTLSLVLPSLVAAALCCRSCRQRPRTSPPVEHVAAVLLVIGCYDDLSECRELPSQLLCSKPTSSATMRCRIR